MTAIEVLFVAVVAANVAVLAVWPFHLDRLAVLVWRGAVAGVRRVAEKLLRDPTSPGMPYRYRPPAGEVEVDEPGITWLTREERAKL